MPFVSKCECGGDLVLHSYRLAYHWSRSRRCRAYVRIVDEGFTVCDDLGPKYACLDQSTEGEKTRCVRCGTVAPLQCCESFAPYVRCHNETKFCTNALRFATHAEAEANVEDLKNRWILVEETKVCPSDDLVNYRWVDGRLEAV